MIRHSLTLKQYYTKFVSLFGLVGTLFASSPLLSLRAPAHISAHLFPPLGQIDGPARIIAVFFALIVTCVVFWFKDADFVKYERGRRVVLTCVLVVAAAFFYCYLDLHQRFVRKLEPLGSEEVYYRSIGFTRTENAEGLYPGKSDEEMLQRRGSKEADINWLWTRRSIRIARSLLFLPYFLGLLSMMTFCSLMVLCAATELRAPPEIAPIKVIEKQLLTHVSGGTPPYDYSVTSNDRDFKKIKKASEDGWIVELLEQAPKIESTITVAVTDEKNKKASRKIEFTGASKSESTLPISNPTG